MTRLLSIELERQSEHLHESSWLLQSLVAQVSQSFLDDLVPLVLAVEIGLLEDVDGQKSVIEICDCLFLLVLRLVLRSTAEEFVYNLSVLEVVWAL